jgi:hypothetical protein
MTMRKVGGGLLWVAASLVGLVAVVLCLTIILLPLGIPLLLLSRRLFGVATRLMMPRQVTHPVSELDKSVRRTGRRLRKNTPTTSPGDVTKKARKRMRKQGKRVGRRLRG